MTEVIIGGILAMLGGLVGIWFQTRNARKVRMDEIIVEKKIAANAGAYSRIKVIGSMLVQASLQDTLKKTRV